MKTSKKIALSLLVIFILGLCIPQNLKIPVKGATKSSYHPKSYWAYPWGKSVTHKGVDIFAKKGTAVNPATSGIVLMARKIPVGGKIVLILGAKWRLHYYAHLNDIKTSSFSFVSQKSTIGTVGDTGNAKGKPPHLHYTIFTPIPYVWRADSSIQGWKKMFYLNPIAYF
ncbi:MAG: M23 family metallopeptidase [Flavobacteriaceae bacterium]|nr:M23 family metallopeptidase [Flavobacteriaceae bacterium]